MNYKIYDNASNLADQIETKIKSCKADLKKCFFSEVVIILDNDKIDVQIEDIRKHFKKISDDYNQCFVPFIIIISPKQIKLKGFLPKKTFCYKITFNDIVDFTKRKKQDKDKTEEVSALLRKLQVFFSYYNELGDEFSFFTSKNKEELIKLEDDTNISVFVNILLLGKTGAGKSTLINLILDEKKSLEGGTGFSTTSKKIVVYKKTGIPIRLYDVKGIEDEETLKNYVDILQDFNQNNNNSMDAINAIIYCMEYTTGTVIVKMEEKLFEKLIKFDIPIIFLITKVTYDINEKPKDNQTKLEYKEYKKTISERKKERDTMIEAINNMIISTFKNKEEGQDYINKYVKIYFVNLVKDYSHNVPVFGVDKVLASFSEAVPENSWETLKKYCFRRDKEKCKELCSKNPYLKYYSEFEKINVRNQDEARKYLKGLKAGAFFTGMIPGLDIGMEYFYKKKFKEKLKALYGFNYDKAKKAVEDEKDEQLDEKLKEKSDEQLEEKLEEKLDEQSDKDSIPLIDGINEISDDPIEENQNFGYNDKDLDERTNNTKNGEEEIDTQIKKKISNKGKNVISTIRGLGEMGSIAIKAIPTVGSVSIKLASWVFLPITCLSFGTWSLINVNKDCQKILDIFVKAITPLKYETLLAYINSFEEALSYLKLIGEKIINGKEDEEDEEDEEEDEKDELDKKEVKK